jgi:prepilin-type N-terminal cleavage/methylation domain-containing protein
VREEQRGFTLIELLMVVAVVAILAWIVIPTWTKESGKSKARSEVSSVFAEFQAKEEQYHADNGVYLAIPPCPATPSAAGTDITGTGVNCIGTASWLALRFAPPEKTMMCSYQVVIGIAGQDPAGSVPPPIGTLNSNPASTWYFVLATCDMDNNSATNSQYMSSNLDSTIQSVNEGY